VLVLIAERAWLVLVTISQTVPYSYSACTTRSSLGMYMHVKIQQQQRHQHSRAHRPAAPCQSSGVSQTPHPTACPQAGIPHRPPRGPIAIATGA